jgi:hypothetical protein
MVRGDGDAVAPLDAFYTVLDQASNVGEAKNQT